MLNPNNFPEIVGLGNSPLTIFPGNPYIHKDIRNSLEMAQSLTTSLNRLSSVFACIENSFFFKHLGRDYLGLPFLHRNESYTLIFPCSNPDNTHMVDWRGDSVQIPEIDIVITKNLQSEHNQSTDILKSFSKAVIARFPSITSISPETSGKRLLCTFLLPVEATTLKSSIVNLDIDPFFKFAVYVPSLAKVEDYPQLMTVKCSGYTSTYINQRRNILSDKFLADLKQCMFQAVK